MQPVLLLLYFGRLLASARGEGGLPWTVSLELGPA